MVVRAGIAGFALSLAVLAGSDFAPAAAAGPPPPLSAQAERAQLRAENAQLKTENRRLHDDFAVLAKFVPREKSLWDTYRDFILSLIVGLGLAPLVASIYTRSQARATLTMEMLKLWLDVWTSSKAAGTVPLQTHGLDIDEAGLIAIERLGNLYEIIAIAVAEKQVDARALERYGMRLVNCEFRALLTHAANLPAKPGQCFAKIALVRDLARWDRGAEWA